MRASKSAGNGTNKIPPIEIPGKIKIEAESEEEGNVKISIPAPKFEQIVVGITGTAPYVQHRWSEKASSKLKEDQATGGVEYNTRRAKRAKRNYDEEAEAAAYKSKQGWYGIPTSHILAAMNDAAKQFKYGKIFKRTVRIPADGFDYRCGTPLVRIQGADYRVDVRPVRFQGVSSPCARPRWDQWIAQVTFIYDPDMLTVKDLMNLLMRAGLNMGLGEGRPNSRVSVGMGWGTFAILESGKAHKSRKQ